MTEKQTTYWKNQKPLLKLTKEDLDKARQNSIIRDGVVYIEHPWFNDATKSLEDDGRSVKVKAVVYRGGIADWCIYHSLDANFTKKDYLDDPQSYKIAGDAVAKYGGKLHNEEIIRSIVDCTDEVFELYRH